jgi:CubicO group peptidase (beta-lactamase class C family)
LFSASIVAAPGEKILIHRRELLVAGTCLGFAPAIAWSKPLLGQNNPVVDAFVKAQAFQGVVMLGRAGKPHYARAFGMAEIETGKPATVETRYAIASISKWLTTTTVLKLVEQGKLSLDAPITKWLPDYRADTGARVTLRHLLSNTSGIPNLFITAAKADATLVSREIGTTEAVKLYAQGDLLFDPGTKFDYALTNWFIVTAIVEAVTGRPFQEAVRAITLDPLDLGRIDASAAVQNLPDSAISYRGTPLVRISGARLTVMAAGGGYYSDAASLIRAAHLIFDTGFLSAESRRQLEKIEAPADDYALGGRIRTLRIGGKIRLAGWETGNAAGYRSVLGHRFDDRSTVVILNNTGMSQKTLDLFADSLFGAEPRLG